MTTVARQGHGLSEPAARVLRAAFLSGVCGLAALSAGCTSASSCPRDTPDGVTIRTGAITGNTYFSAPYGGPYTHFQPATTVTFEHHLCAGPPSDGAAGTAGVLEPTAGAAGEAGAPASVGSSHCVVSPPQIWLAFRDTGTVAPSAGNESILVDLNPTSLAIKNDTCSDFYVWLLAERTLSP